MLAAFAASPAEVRFELSLGGRAVVQEGETIPMRLLSSSARDTYYTDIRGYDSSGRLPDEVFCLEVMQQP